MTVTYEEATMRRGYKTCLKCKTEKPVGEFTPAKRYLNGLYSWCKECVRERDRERAADPEFRAKGRERTRAYRKRNAEAQREQARQHRRENPEKIRAQNAINGRVRHGTLTRQPCRVCGSSERVHAHHPDYAKPLDVYWLCAQHHRQLHTGRVVIVRPRVTPFGRLALLAG
jgi:hypothetical protein